MDQKKTTLQLKKDMEKVFKTKNEYCHILGDKLVISKTPEADDLISDYTASVNSVFKTLMVFFIFLPIFTFLTILFYDIGMMGLAFQTGSFGFLWLFIAFYIMLFTSGSPSIKRECIDRIKIRKGLFNNVSVSIGFNEFGRQKKRHLILEKNQIDDVKGILLSEKLIESKDIELHSRGVNVIEFAMFFSIIVPPSLFWIGIKDIQTMAAYYGSLVVIISSVLLVAMIRNFMKSS